MYLQFKPLRLLFIFDKLDSISQRRLLELVICYSNRSKANHICTERVHTCHRRCSRHINYILSLAELSILPTTWRLWEAFSHKVIISRTLVQLHPSQSTATYGFFNCTSELEQYGLHKTAQAFKMSACYHHLRAIIKICYYIKTHFTKLSSLSDWKVSAVS